MLRKGSREYSYRMPFSHGEQAMVSTWGNLVSFYSVIAELSGAGPVRDGSLVVISHPGTLWPSCMLGGSGEMSLKIRDIVHRMKKGALPNLWFRMETPGDRFAWLAGEAGMKKTDSWLGMALERNEAFGYLPPSGCVMERITGEPELREWFGILNHEVMGDRRIDYRLFRNALHDSRFEFFRILRGKRTISTLLGFQEGEVTGIYMVSTKKEMRGRGYGLYLTSAALDYYIRKGFRKFVLHSTQSGYSLYKRLGFRENSSVGIYMLSDQKWKGKRMEMAEIRERVMKVFREIINSEIVPSDDSVRGVIPGWDDRSHITFLKALEKEFGIRFGLEDFRKTHTFGDVCRAVEQNHYA